MLWKQTLFWRGEKGWVVEWGWWRDGGGVIKYVCSECYVSANQPGPETVSCKGWLSDFTYAIIFTDSELATKSKEWNTCDHVWHLSSKTLVIVILSSRCLPKWLSRWTSKQNVHHRWLASLKSWSVEELEATKPQRTSHRQPPGGERCRVKRGRLQRSSLKGWKRWWSVRPTLELVKKAQL